MLLMLVRRVLLGLVTVCIVSLIIFAGVEILPGDALHSFWANIRLMMNCWRNVARTLI